VDFVACLLPLFALFAVFFSHIVPIDTQRMPLRLRREIEMECRSVRCPICGSLHVYKSARGNAGLAFPVTWFVVWIRCYTCGRKFFRLGLLPGRGIPEAKVPSPVGARRQAA